MPCGVWEAVTILDGLLKNPSDLPPDTVHAATPGQRAAVFGRAALLGIHLMPRIRQWTHLRFYRPSRTEPYRHIDELFIETIDWELIATHLPDMVRVVRSIKAGRLTPSPMLGKLSTYRQKNKRYHACRAWGRAIRPKCLLEYMSDEELRVTINAAMNNRASFTQCAQWLAFGGARTIRETDRDDQRKLVKYTPLVANCVIFANVFAMSQAFQGLAATGAPVRDAVRAALRPSLTAHINRLGRYARDRKRRALALDDGVFARPVAPGKERAPALAVASCSQDVRWPQNAGIVAIPQYSGAGCGNAAKPSHNPLGRDWNSRAFDLSLPAVVEGLCRWNGSQLATRRLLRRLAV